MTVPTLNQYGIGVTLPAGWEGVIFRRPPVAGETTQPILHAGSFALPTVRGDYGSGAVEQMTSTDSLVVLVEFDPADAGRPLFAHPRPKSLTGSDFSPRSLQHPISGQVGTQRFFADNGRAFCLYVVLGSSLSALFRLPTVNQVIQTLQLAASAAG